MTRSVELIGKGCHGHAAFARGGVMTLRRKVDVERRASRVQPSPEPAP